MGAPVMLVSIGSLHGLSEPSQQLKLCFFHPDVFTKENLPTIFWQRLDLSMKMNRK